MPRLQRKVRSINIRWEEADLTDEQLSAWLSGDEDLLEEVYWRQVGDKSLEEVEIPELKQD
tara:strand:+ start:1779 stop:1961 length:183 start_codon:yes stop_codon:yes gene_type:complete